LVITFRPQVLYLGRFHSGQSRACASHWSLPFAPEYCTWDDSIPDFYRGTNTTLIANTVFLPVRTAVLAGLRCHNNRTELENLKWQRIVIRVLRHLQFFFLSAGDGI
jgi:hypothetical protein